MSLIDSHIQHFEQLLPQLPALAPGVRERALEYARSEGLPHTRLEDWKYTSLARLARESLSPPIDAALHSVPQDEVDAARLLATDELVFLNGLHHVDLDRRAAPQPGAAASSLAHAFGRTGGEPPYDPSTAQEATSLGALNTAFLRDGADISIADDSVIEPAIHLLFVTTPGVAAHVRNRIRLGRNSRATVIEHYRSSGEGAVWSNCVTDIHLGEGARLAHYKLQAESPDSYHTASITAQQSAASAWESSSIALGGGTVRNDIHSHFLAPGASCAMDGLFLLSGSQHVDHHTTVDHAHSDCTSTELYKGILGDRSTGVFNGKVIVRAGAQRTDAQQMNKNLLLSDRATINTKPQLEIFADDVRCSHGATIGRLDEEAVFYLRSRGIGEGEARAILIHAFANEIAERLRSDSLRTAVTDMIRARLRGIATTEGRP